jgi:hypothetical protein
MIIATSLFFWSRTRERVDAYSFLAHTKRHHEPIYFGQNTGSARLNLFFGKHDRRDEPVFLEQTQGARQCL